MTKNKNIARDFFLNLGAFAALYASVIAITTLLFEVINVAFPRVASAYYYNVPSISFQVATLIVAFPLFLLLSRILEKNYAKEPELREGWVRRWLSYITLFVAGGFVVGDLITVIYLYLDGQELTAGFLLKVLVLLVVAGGVFAYYMRELKNKIDSRERSLWRVGSAILVIVVIVLGFVVVGSPAAQRDYKLDNTRVSDLQNLQWQIVNYWQQKGEMPQSLGDLNDPLRDGRLPTDPETAELYTYNHMGGLSFELCAEFMRDSDHMRPIGSSMMSPKRVAYDTMMEGGALVNADNWQHPAGMHCFERTIDPELYPVRTTQ